MLRVNYTVHVWKLYGCDLSVDVLLSSCQLALVSVARELAVRSLSNEVNSELCLRDTCNVNYGDLNTSSEEYGDLNTSSEEFLGGGTKASSRNKYLHIPHPLTELQPCSNSSMTN